MRVLVTGAAGFIGSHATEAFASRGDQVTAVDNFDDYYDPARKRATWQELARHATVRLVEGDLGTKGLARDLVDGQDVVVHLAARPGVRASIEDPRRTYRANLETTLELVEAMRQDGAPKRLVFGSTSSVYGGDAPVPFEEDRPSSRPLSPYAASKRAAELLIANYVELFGLGAFTVRFFTVYGPRGRPDMSIGKFVEACLRGQRVPLYGDGSITRDFTYVDDIVRGVVAAADRVKPRDLAIANLGGSQRHSMKDLIGLIEKECGRALLVDRKPNAPGDAPTTWASTARAEALLGWKAAVRLPEGVARTVAWAKGKL